MPDEYDAARKGLTRYERGLYFELGRAHIRGETAEKGWVRQFPIKLPGKDAATRVLDSARTDGRGTKGVERKSGRVDERGTLRQLSLERQAFDTGQLTHSTWETVEGEKIPRSVTAAMDQMGRDFRGKFEHDVLSRAEAARAMLLGKSLASRQLELIRTYELDRAQRARERLGKIREIVRARERADRIANAERFREAAGRGHAEATKKNREREQERQRTLEQLQQQRALTDRQRVEREASQRVAREFGDRWRSMERRERGEREQRAAGDVPELRAVREYVERVQQVREAADAAESARLQAIAKADERAREEREAAERARQERDAADALLRSRLPPDVTDLLFKGRPTPGLG